MNMPTEPRRRRFFRQAAWSAAAAVSGQSLLSCDQPASSAEKLCRDQLLFNHPDYHSSDGPAGLLYSQLGYQTDQPVMLMIRLPRKELLPDQTTCRLLHSESELTLEQMCEYWGEKWGSHWWTITFPAIAERGEWQIEIKNKNHRFFKANGLRTGSDLLWNQTVPLMAADMLERRVHFTKVGAGWQDAGSLWVESPAQSAMVIALTELLEKAKDRLDQQLQLRIHNQIKVGADYFPMLRKKARELGFEDGAQSHDLHGHEKDILPNDAMKSVIALCRAIRFLPPGDEERKKVYSETAHATFNWLVTRAMPMGDKGLSRFQRGLPETASIPANEWQTRDLLSLCWAALEMRYLDHPYAEQIAKELALKIMARQIAKADAESGFYGHFREYDTLLHSEKSWIHGIVNNEFGADIGGIYPNYLMPVLTLLQTWPNDRDASKWREMLHNFTYGYLISACKQNPFLLVPQGIFGNEGAIWFCGTFHGTNTIYGYTAALAFELAKLFNDNQLVEIGYANLQWIAGLNAGITRQNLEQGCVIFSADLPDGAALPASMICGVGNRWAGSWFQTRGVVCNGFSTGKQFVYDTAPIRKNDGPFSLTDEDWIPHSAAWITGLVRL